MFSRRAFLGTVGTGLIVGPHVAAANGLAAQRKRLAVVTTEWRYHSHAWHMAERFLVGYPVNGHWYRPPLDVVGAYVDQKPENDLSRKRSEEFGFPIYPTIAETLRCGGDKLAVDGVLIIGEHGTYPMSEYEQTKYPRYEFFKQVSDVFRQDGRAVPVFNDKHLSWKWEWAKEMVEISRELNFAFTAGSSLPVTWRMPAIDMPYDAEVEELMCVSIGSIDSYDFHALEVIQCMAERRSQTLAQPETFSHRYPTPIQIREWVKDPIVYRFEYADGVKATMLLMNGLVGDFTFAARLKGAPEPLSTLFYLPPTPNVTYSASLMSKAEETFMTGKSPYPIERTLLTTGLVEAGVRSLGTGQIKLETPHLAIRYQAPRESTFVRS